MSSVCAGGCGHLLAVHYDDGCHHIDFYGGKLGRCRCTLTRGRGPGGRRQAAANNNNSGRNGGRHCGGGSGGYNGNNSHGGRRRRPDEPERRHNRSNGRRPHRG